MLRRDEAARSWVAAVAAVMGATDALPKPTVKGDGAPRRGTKRGAYFASQVVRAGPVGRRIALKMRRSLCRPWVERVRGGFP